MRPSELQARSIASLMFVAANAMGLALLWAAGPELLEAGALVIIAGNFAVLARAASRDPGLLLALLFAIVFALFHFSLLPISVFNQQFLQFHPFFSRWYFGIFTAQAYWVSLIFFLAVVTGAMVGKRAGSSSRNSHVIVETDGEHSDILLLVFAAIILYFFIAIFFILGITNYTEYNQIARVQNAGFVEGSLVLLYPMIGASAMLCAARARSRKLFLTLFAIWAVPAFAVGLRGYVLFPAALMLPFLLQRFNLRFRLAPILLGATGLLWMVSFGRIARSRGEWAEALRGASPIDGFAELGGSLRPVFEVVRWTESGTVHWYWGGTYWAPIERLFQKLMPFIDPLPAQLDDRLMNVAIVKLTGGNYGFSIAAEAYVNFGFAGAVIVGLLIGYALRRIGRQFALGHLGIVSAALAYAIFYHIRQSYVGAWSSFIVSAVFIWAMLKLDQTARRFFNGPGANPDVRAQSGWSRIQ